MAMTIREALEKSRKKLLAQIDDVMTNDVFEEVKDEEAATIDAVVYGVYTPKMYRRRGEYGGLAYTGNIEIAGGRAAGGRMIVINTTEPNDDTCDGGGTIYKRTGELKSLPELVEFGHGYRGNRYDYPKRGRPYMGPRPFTAKTIENLRESGAHVQALKSGLERKGFKVEKK